ncbi:MAG: glycosyltransferase family 4 protein [Candidatus Omnitrophota bacterium]
MAKKKLSIAHLHWGFPPIIGGVETHLTIVLPQFVSMGHTTSLLTGTVDGSKVNDTYKGVRIRRTPLMDLNWLYKRGLLGIDKEFRKTLTEFVNKEKPDVLHAHNMHYFSRPHADVLEKISREKGIPIFLTAHNIWDDMLFLKLTTEIKWTHIIAVSHFIRKELIGVGCDHRKITTIHHGIDTERFHPKKNLRLLFKKYPQLKGRRIIFHPARMGLAKGCDVSIKALRIIKQTFPEAMLVLAGTKNIIDWGDTHQKDIAYMVSLVESFGLRDNVLIDCYKLDEMPYIYAASQVCLYPSSSPEPFGLTMLESMATSRPIIVTRTGGMPEIVRDGINGFIVPIRDFEGLAARVTALFNDDNLRDRLGASGREMMEQQYTKRILANNTLRIYKNFC